jgi:CRISPR-associated protein Csx10
MSAFTVRLTMLSDWRIGTGTGRHGEINRLVVRDETGLPYVPAKTLVGVWRDACEVAATGLDAGRDGVWHRWVGFTFGEQPALAGSDTVVTGPPRPAALSATRLVLAPDVVQILGQRPAVAAAITFLKPGVSIDRQSGLAARRAWHLDEMVRAGLTLQGDGAIFGYGSLDDAQQSCVVALLRVGAQLMESIGGGRRRGAGQCHFEIDGIGTDTAAALDWLESGPPVPEPPTMTQPAPVIGTRASSAEYCSDGWECVELGLRLLTPTVVGERTVGNAVRSLDYIPGRILLPAILRMLDIDAAHLAARAGGLVVTDATVEIDGVAGRRAPNLLVSDKAEPAWLANRGVEDIPAAMHPTPVDGYVGPFTGQACPSVAMSSRAEYAHNTIADAEQRPTEEVGGLYTYEAITAGTVLRAQVRVAPGVLPDDWWSRLRGTIRVGRSQKDDYGRVDVSPELIAAPPPPEVSDDARLRVWLLSDLLIYDPRLRPSTHVDDVARVLGDALGVTLRTCGPDTWATPRRGESWHRNWTLPRPTLLGPAAGTCLTFDVDGELDEDRMTRLQIMGVGQRRAEGFGQICFNDPLLSAALSGLSRENCLLEGDTGRETDGPAATTLPAASKETMAMLRIVERAAWTTAIHSESERIAASPEGRRKALDAGYADVPMAQLSGLRTAVGRSRVDSTRWLTGLTANPAREKAWPKAVREQLHRLFNESDVVWDLLAIDQDALSTTPSARADMRSELQRHALATVIGDCLSAHTRTRDARTD